MECLALTPTGGLDTQNGVGPLVVDGAEAAQAELISIFRTQAGEWPHNKEFGVDYNGEILGKFFDDVAASAILAGDASEAANVAPVPASRVTFGFDPEPRKLTFTIAPVYAITGERFDFVGTVL